MVKIKINKSLLYKKLNEEEDNWEELPQGQELENEPSDNNVELNNADGTEQVTPQMQSLQHKGFSDDLMALQFTNLEEAKLMKKVPLMSIKFNNAYDAFKKILFPTGSSLLSNLLVKIDLPKKFLNTKSMITDPESHIKHTSDLAKKYFGKVSNDWISYYGNVKNENINYTENTNNKNLNESAIGTAALGVSAFSVAYKGIGKVGALLFSDFDSLGYNLSDVYSTNTKKDPGVKNGDLDDTKAIASEIKNFPAAIDSYLQDILSMMSNLLHLWYGDNRQEIKNLILTTSSIIGASGRQIEKYLYAKNLLLKEIENNRQDKEIRSFEKKHKALKTIILNLEKLEGKGLKDSDLYKKLKSQRERILNDDYSENDLHVERIDFDTDNILTNSKKNLNESDDSNDEFDFTNTDNKKETNKTKLSESNPNNKLEDNDKKTDVEPFDADEIYNKILEVLNPLVQDVINQDPENVDVIKKARELMQTMKENASKNVVDRIKLVCKTEINSSNSDLGSQASAFLSKHPIQANRLLDVWRSHEQDLQDRINRRIKSISTISDVSPLTMYKLFISRVFPNLVALLMTYKTIIIILMDKRNQSVSTKKLITTIDKQALANIGKGHAMSMKLNMLSILKEYNDIFSNGLNRFIDDKGNIEWNNVSPYFCYIFANLCKYKLGESKMTINQFGRWYYEMRELDTAGLLVNSLITYMLNSKNTADNEDIVNLRLILDGMKNGNVINSLDSAISGFRNAYNNWKNVNIDEMTIDGNLSVDGGEKIENILAFMCLACSILKENPDVINNPSQVISEYFSQLYDLESVDSKETFNLYNKFIDMTFFIGENGKVKGKEIFDNLLDPNTKYDKYLLLLCLYYGLGISGVSIKNAGSGNNGNVNLNEDLFLLEAGDEGEDNKNLSSNQSFINVNVDHIEDKYIEGIDLVINYLGNEQIIKAISNDGIISSLVKTCNLIYGLSQGDNNPKNTIIEILKSIYADLNLISNFSKYGDEDVSDFIKQNFYASLKDTDIAKYLMRQLNIKQVSVENLMKIARWFSIKDNKNKILELSKNPNRKEIVYKINNLILSYFNSFNPVSTDYDNVIINLRELYNTNSDKTNVNGLDKSNLTAFFKVSLVDKYSINNKSEKIPSNELNYIPVEEIKDFNIEEVLSFSEILSGLKRIKNASIQEKPDTKVFTDDVFNPIFKEMEKEFNNLLHVKYQNNEHPLSVVSNNNSSDLINCIFDINNEMNGKESITDIFDEVTLTKEGTTLKIKDFKNLKDKNNEELLNSKITKNDRLIFFQSIYEYMLLNNVGENGNNIKKLYKFIIGQNLAFSRFGFIKNVNKDNIETKYTEQIKNPIK